MNDSHRYLEYAQNLHGGFYFEPHNFWYFGYVLFVYANSLFSDASGLLIASQHLLSFFSVIALYRTSTLLFSEKMPAILTCLLYILFIDIPSWNSYILAESFYVSMTCMSLYVIALFYRGRRGWKFYTIGSLTLLLTLLAKPTGIVLLVAIASILFRHVISKIPSRAARYAFIFALSSSILLLGNKMLSTYQVIENYQLGEIIYAVTTIPELPSLEQLVVTPSQSLVLPSPSDPKILQICQFVVQNPMHWFELFFKKVFYFLSHTRPFWSLSHNLVSILVLVPTYFFFVFVIMKKMVPNDVGLFCIVYLTMHTLSIGLTSVDWDGRFLIPVLPVLFLLAGKGISSVRSTRVMKYMGWKPSS